MKNTKWTATKKEFTFNGEGKEIPEKITYEKDQRNWLDLIIKSIGVFAIFTPLLLLYLQKDAEVRLENAKNRSELYTDVLTDLQLIMDDNEYSKDFEFAVKNIRFKYRPKVQLINDSKLNNIYSDIASYTVLQDFLLSYSALSRRLVRERENKIDPFIKLYKGIRVVQEEDHKDEMLRDINKLISGIKELQGYGWDDRKRSGIKFYQDTLIRISEGSLSEMYYLRDYLQFDDKYAWQRYLECHYLTNKAPYDLGYLVYPIRLAVRKNADKINQSKKKFEERLLKLL